MLGKRLLNRFLLNRGYVLSRVGPNGPKRDAFADMKRLCATRNPLVLDVGANVGQSILRFRESFDNPSIHAFEPGEETFAILSDRMRAVPNVFLTNAALGARCENRVFVRHAESEMSSLLEPGPDCWGSVLSRSEIQLRTVDGYCHERGIRHVDILKSDTQGFDLEVLKGAQETLRNTHLVYIELIFSQMYQGNPRFDQIYAFLADRSFIPVSFYEMYYQRGLLSWTDALFVNSGMP
jgi:FkbM family methyltransferase